MEMASSRRPPLDPSRELSLKKPRLNENHPLQLQRTVNVPASVSGSARFRVIDRERESDDMQHQELVSQYKIALSELTFNSKPIITNLTIIAGENVQAAKAIASIICDNIIEVPSDQKLPSLYLLDSIVKNIGRDYIKYFATRISEVFCKAYRQVEPSIHNSIRHLFGTWKGVFPPQSLQIIEKELGFGASVNCPSSGSPTSWPESHSQRQPHSIHVNPKYLEARHRMQLSSMTKGADIGEADVECYNDVDNNIRPQTEALKRVSQLKQGGRGYEAFGFSSAFTRSLSTGVSKLRDKQWPGASREMEESIPGQRNGYDMNRGMSNLWRSAEVPKGWKNSGEDEYLWDDLGTKVIDPSPVCGANKDILASDQEKMEPHKMDSSNSCVQVGHHSVTGLSPAGISARFSNAISGSSGFIGQHNPSLVHQRPAFSKRDPRQNFPEKDPIRPRFTASSDPRITSLSTQLNVENQNLQSVTVTTSVTVVSLSGLPHKKEIENPALLTPPSSSPPLSGTLTKASNVASGDSDPFSSLLSSNVEVENIIGFQFKPPILRKLHSSVIDKLLEELPHRCTTCGLQFKLKQTLISHSDRHAFRSSIQSSLNKPSRRWYSDSNTWVSGKTGFPFVYYFASLVEKSENEKVVPADETQCVCLLCGELFQDVYSQERDEWMFNGATYMSSITSGSYESGTSSEDDTTQNLIVHANCVSHDCANEFGLVCSIKEERAL